MCSFVKLHYVPKDLIKKVDVLHKKLKLSLQMKSQLSELSPCNGYQLLCTNNE